MTEDDSAETGKEGPLKWLGQEIRKHSVGGTILELNTLGAQTIGDPKMANMDVSQFLPGGDTTILGQPHGTLIVLVQGTGSHSVSLVMEEIHGPDCVWQIVTGANKLSFSGTLGV